MEDFNDIFGVICFAIKSTLKLRKYMGISLVIVVLKWNSDEKCKFYKSAVKFAGFVIWQENCVTVKNWK